MNEMEGDSFKINQQEMDHLIDSKYRMVYSERLGRKVYVLKKWVDKGVFKRHKRLFGYTDIGWTVKHPKQLIRALASEGIWGIDDEN